MTATQTELLSLTANCIRGLAMDAVEKANSGHPGMPMGMAELAAVLWTRHLRYSVVDPLWPGRDRFVLSAGHGSILLYSLLHLAGFPLSMEDLKHFRQLGSLTPGHPEYGDTVGVEVTGGPLGSGFGAGVGMALAARMEADRFANPLYQNRVVGIVSDGDLMEGVSSESASLAGHLRLSNLYYFYDDNQITIEGPTSLAFSEDVEKRFQALGWRVLHCRDGHNLSELAQVMQETFTEAEQPTLVICRTQIAKGSPNKEGSAKAHGSPLGEIEVILTKQTLGISEEPFYVPAEVKELFAERAKANEEERQAWLQAAAEAEARTGELAALHQAYKERRVPEDLLGQLVVAAGNEAAATRVISGQVIQKAAELVPSLVVGSADLEPSTKTRIKNSPAVSPDRYSGRNLHFGIRENGMGMALNGMALHGGCLPVGSTFLVFSDYMRPAIRLAALMGLPVGYVFTHDSLMVGEDGPTHQPVEQLASLRLIPNLQVWRPADGAEVAAAWHALLTRREGPVAMALSRQSLPPIPRPEDFDLARLAAGGYVAHEPEAGAKPTAVVVATGSELAMSIEAAGLLATKGLQLRVVSMPCLEQFKAQEKGYREEVLPPGLPVLAVEMGRPEGLCQLTGSLARVIGVEHYGMSAPAAEIAEALGFTAEKIALRLEEMLSA